MGRAATSSSITSPTDLSSLTVVKLKEELKLRGVTSFGGMLKNDLIVSLQQLLNKDNKKKTTTTTSKSTTLSKRKKIVESDSDNEEEEEEEESNENNKKKNIKRTIPKKPAKPAARNKKTTKKAQVESEEESSESEEEEEEEDTPANNKRRVVVVSGKRTTKVQTTKQQQQSKNKKTTTTETKKNSNNKRNKVDSSEDEEEESEEESDDEKVVQPKKRVKRGADSSTTSKKTVAPKPKETTTKKMQVDSDSDSEEEEVKKVAKKPPTNMGPMRQKRSSNSLPMQERLFWSVWGTQILNKQIFRTIQSFDPYTGIRYDQAHSMNWLIKNNYYNLLRQKLIRDEYVSFQHRDLGILFKYMRENKLNDDADLLKALMKHKELFMYASHSEHPYMCEASPIFLKMVKNDPELHMPDSIDMIHAMVECDNLEGLSTFLKLCPGLMTLAGMIDSNLKLQKLLPVIREYINPSSQDFITEFKKKHSKISINFDYGLDIIKYLISMNAAELMVLDFCSVKIVGHFVTLHEYQHLIDLELSKINKAYVPKSKKIEIDSLKLTDQDKLLVLFDAPVDNDRIAKLCKILLPHLDEYYTCFVCTKYDIENSSTSFDDSIVYRFMKLSSLPQVLENKIGIRYLFGISVGNINEQKQFLDGVFAKFNDQRLLTKVIGNIATSKEKGADQLLSHACTLYGAKGLEKTIFIDSDISMDCLEVLNLFDWIKTAKVSLEHGVPNYEALVYLYEKGATFQGDIAPYFIKALESADITTAYQFTIGEHSRYRVQSFVYRINPSYLDPDEHFYYLRSTKVNLSEKKVDQLSKSLVRKIGEEGATRVVREFMDRFFKTENQIENRQVLLQLIEGAYSNGHLHILKMLNEDYKHVFKLMHRRSKNGNPKNLLIRTDIVELISERCVENIPICKYIMDECGVDFTAKQLANAAKSQQQIIWVCTKYKDAYINLVQTEIIQSSPYFKLVGNKQKVSQKAIKEKQRRRDWYAKYGEYG